MGNSPGARCDDITLATPGVQGLQPYQPGKPVSELERELGISNIVKLASNENPLGPSQASLEAMTRALSDLSRYPDGSGFELKQALQKHYGLKPEAITLGNGSNDVLDLIIRAYAGPGDEVIYSQYGFAVYAIGTQAVNASAVVTPAKEFGHDLDAMAAAVTTNTKLIFVANPNNPTGTWHGKEAMTGFLKSVPEDVIVVLDEAYCEYFEDADYPDGLTLMADFPNLLVTRTFSKAWGLAGLRVGYAVSSPAIAEVLNRVRHPFNVNTLAQVAAAAALEDRDYLQKSVQLNREGMQQLQESFVKTGLDYIPSAGNFVTLDVGRSGQEVYDSLLHEGVIVRPLAGYGMPNHLRVSIGLAAENQRFIDALAKVL